jgi:hypothetical protein
MGLMGHIINGTFFSVPDESGAVPVGERSAQAILFGGSFRKENDNSSVFVGVMIDRLGESELTNIVFTDTQFSFTKRYLDRDDKIRYCLKKCTENVWEGEWAGDACGYGLAKCVVLPVPDAVFQPLILFENQCFQCGSLLDNDPGDVHLVHV